MTYLNEFDTFAADWLRNLNLGIVDQRSIKDVLPTDLVGYRQCHFFAGIGGWPLALGIAGWPGDREVWTGSCPCQPLSRAGKRRGEKDERHLWPEFYRLISECRPSTIFGEQVASNDGLEWLDGISLDLEELGYAVCSADLPAACVNLPHVRQRIFWCVNSNRNNDQRKRTPRGSTVNETWRGVPEEKQEREVGFHQLVSMGATQGPFAYSEARRMVHGIPNIVGRIRGFGNAIVPSVAAKFIKAFLEIDNGAVHVR